MLDREISGTVLEARIKQVCQSSKTTKAVYKLKSSSSDLSRNRSLYTDEQIAYLKDTLPNYLYFFGYIDVDPDSKTNFFESESHTEINLLKYRGYQRHNLVRIMDPVSWQVNTTPECMSMWQMSKMPRANDMRLKQI